MSRPVRFVLGAGLLAGGVFVGFLIGRAQSRGGAASPQPPEAGGRAVPDRLLEIPFDRRYTLSCSFPPDGPREYRDCKILGWTGAGEGRASGSRGFSLSSGSGYDPGNPFEHWLALELADGRRAYFPSMAVRSIEESAPPPAPKSR